MDIHIDEIVSSVRAVDDKALLSPQVLGRIVETVLEAVERREKHGARVGAERSVTGGVADEQDSEA
jgi:hypothetical protein